MQIPKHTLPFLFLEMRASPSSSAMSWLRPRHPATLSLPKMPNEICQNGARGHRCFEASIITIAGELLLLQSAVLYWVQIFFSCSNLLYTVLLLSFVKNKTKKKKSSKLPISLRVPFFPSNKRIKAICLLFVLFGARPSVSLFRHFFQPCIFSTNSLN